MYVDIVYIYIYIYIYIYRACVSSYGDLTMISPTICSEKSNIYLFQRNILPEGWNSRACLKFKR